jgi:ABC-2 type transport system ATP-binding protein
VASADGSFYGRAVAINVEQLTMRFRVSRREPGLRRSMAGLLRRTFDEVLALDDVSFTVGEGEVVGFLGPNGAGKTTTLKCLSGLLHPTSGHVRVFGHTPHQREGDFLRGISLVMGQRNSLFWDLPALDAFEVNRSIYRIPESSYRVALDELVDLLGLAPLLTKPVRVLSLGERMRCELAGALLHRPRVLFLDEPTLGLDVTAQAAVRGFFADYNARSGATMLLTSHYMGDVTALAKRVVVIDAGRLRFDGDLDELSRRYVDHRLIKLRLRERATLSVAAEVGEVVSSDGLALTVRVAADQTAAAAGRLLTDLPVEDLSIEEPPMEDVIRAVFERR